MRKKKWIILLTIATAGFALHAVFWQIPANNLKNEDIFFIWLEGKRILLGENPYARVLSGDLRVNDKYATYFPLIYLLSTLIQKLGLTEFRDWLFIWRPISYLFHIGICALLLKSFQQRRAEILGFGIVLIMIFNRWSLYIIRVHHIEFAAIFFLLFSLIWLDKKSKLSLLMYSVSLGVKQIAIFLLPLYLIHLYQQSSKDKRFQEIMVGVLIILSIPVMTSLPFLVWNAEGFFKSIAFSATRLGESHILGAPSIDLYASETLPWIVGFRAKALMLFLMGLTYLSFLKEKVGIWISSSITLMIFVYFNSVLFLQYFIWPISLTLFTFAESINNYSRADHSG